MSIFSLKDLLKKTPVIPMPSKSTPAICLLNNIPDDPFPDSIAFRLPLFSLFVS
jgi:hypothetical protein